MSLLFIVETFHPTAGCAVTLRGVTYTRTSTMLNEALTRCLQIALSLEVLKREAKRQWAMLAANGYGRRISDSTFHARGHGSLVVKALGYKPEGRGFETR
jgi:hypothetical protein